MKKTQENYKNIKFLITPFQLTLLRKVNPAQETGTCIPHALSTVWVGNAGSIYLIRTFL